jgi:cytochrome c oxidase subunit IV
VPFFILFALTALEFLIAFTMPGGLVRTLIFLFLTILKAFYIIAYFMHMKFERIGLVYSVGIPFLFVVYLVILLLIEGGYIYNNSYGG